MRVKKAVKIALLYATVLYSPHPNLPPHKGVPRSLREKEFKWDSSESDPFNCQTPLICFVGWGESNEPQQSREKTLGFIKTIHPNLRAQCPTKTRNVPDLQSSQPSSVRDRSYRYNDNVAKPMPRPTPI